MSEMKKKISKPRYLTFDERLSIKKYLLQKKNISLIASILNRSRLGILKELNKNGGCLNYNPVAAQEKANIRNHYNKNDILMFEEYKNNQNNLNEILISESPIPSIRPIPDLFDSPQKCDIENDNKKQINILKEEIACLRMQLQIIADTLK